MGLTIQVGESFADALQDGGKPLQAVIDGQEVAPHFGVGFENRV